jgi:osmoprotectant transport system substrate-binding protein
MRAGRATRIGSIAATCAVLAFATACGASADTVRTSVLGDDAISVASFNFPESTVLAEIYAQALEGAGFRVDRQLDLGPREMVEPALQRGLVELVPEYAGSALAFTTLGGAPVAGDQEDTNRALAEALAPRGIMALEPARAEDQNGFAVTRATAERYGLRTISDLTSVASALTFGGPVECPRRPLCLQGLESTYGLHFESFVPLDTSGPLTAAALADGTVDVALVFTTDGQITQNDFVLLQDDLGLQPAENVTPVVRDDTVRRFGPQLVDVLNAVSAELTDQALRVLNAQVGFQGIDPAHAARAWLVAHGFVSGAR